LLLSKNKLSLNTFYALLVVSQELKLACEEDLKVWSWREARYTLVKTKYAALSREAALRDSASPSSITCSRDQQNWC